MGWPRHRELAELHLEGELRHVGLLVLGAPAQCARQRLRRERAELGGAACAAGHGKVRPLLVEHERSLR